jgi:hypothetical protein
MVNNGTFPSPTHGIHLTSKTLFHGKGEGKLSILQILIGCAISKGVPHPRSPWKKTLWHGRN